MLNHILSAYVVVTPLVGVIALGTMVGGRSSSILPLVFIIVFLVTAVVAVVHLLRKGHGRVLGGWYSACALLAGLSCLIVLLIQSGRGNDATPIILTGGFFLSTAIAAGYAAFGKRRPSGTSSSQAHAVPDWISIQDNGQEIAFRVRQKRTVRAKRSVLLIAGLLVGIALSLLAMYASYRHYAQYGDLSLLAWILLVAGFLFSIACFVAALAALPSLVPALRGLAAAGTASFTIGPRGVNVDGEANTVPFAVLTGPFYRISNSGTEALTSIQIGAGVVYGGVGLGGAMAVAAAATTHGAHELGRSVARSAKESFDLVKKTSSGEVFIRNASKAVPLARLLSDEEAEFLCGKVAEAILRMVRADASLSPARSAYEAANAAKSQAAGQLGILNISIDNT